MLNSLNFCLSVKGISKAVTIKLLEENTAGYFCDFEKAKYYLVKTQNAITIKEKRTGFY